MGDEPFAVILPDVILDRYSADLTKVNLKEMLSHFEQSGASQILVEPVPEEEVSNYGIVDCMGEHLQPGDSKTHYSCGRKTEERRSTFKIYLLLVVMCCLKTFGLY